MLLAAPVWADSLRLATWHAGLERSGPGLLLRDLAGSGSPQADAAVRVLVALDADVILLTGVDFDAGHAAIGALKDRLAAAGAIYPHHFALPPNTGLPTGLDLDGNGRVSDARDAQGWGRFPGAGGMVLLSRLPVDSGAARDFSGFLWRDLPGADLPPDIPERVRAVQRLSTTGHWDVAVILPDGTRLHLLAFHATPPVFDGPEDRNGRRNHDETAFWLRLLDGALSMPPPAEPFAVLGTAGLDPSDGDGRPDALRALLAHPRLTDPRPSAPRAESDPGHRGDPALDTAFYGGRAGALRVDYVLPSVGLRVVSAGLLSARPGTRLAADLAVASRHLPVWVDVSLSSAPPRVRQAKP